MKARLDELLYSELHPTIRALADGGFDKELADLVRKPGNAVKAVEAMRQRLLDGDMVASTPGRLIDITTQVELLIKAGYHEAAGLSASAYRQLWPKTVVQPLEYAGRFDAVLLVDTTIKASELVSRGNIYTYVQPSACTDLVKAPTALRYIAFVQLGQKNLGRTVEDCAKTFAPDEVGLTTVEGLHLPVQHKAYLRQYAIDLAGSRYVSVDAPYVYWFVSGRPFFFACDVRLSHPSYGSASRGSAIITVP